MLSYNIITTTGMKKVSSSSTQPQPRLQSELGNMYTAIQNFILGFTYHNIYIYKQIHTKTTKISFWGNLSHSTNLTLLIRRYADSWFYVVATVSIISRSVLSGSVTIQDIRCIGSLLNCCFVYYKVKRSVSWLKLNWRDVFLLTIFVSL